MEIQQVIDRIKEAVPEPRDIQVEGSDSDFSVLVLCESFHGEPFVKRQRKIRFQFSDVLSTGELHALLVGAYTPGEWQQKTQRLQHLSKLFARH